MRGAVVVLAFSLTCCAHVHATAPAAIKPKVIKGVCEDPPMPLPDGVIWTRPPCTLFAKK